MCDLLTVQDSNIVQVALNGLENILKAGNQHKIKPNPYAVLVEECYGNDQNFNNFFLCILIQNYTFF